MKHFANVTCTGCNKIYVFFLQVGHQWSLTKWTRETFSRYSITL